MLAAPCSCQCKNVIQQIIHICSADRWQCAYMLRAYTIAQVSGAIYAMLAHGREDLLQGALQPHEVQLKHEMQDQH